MVKNIVIKWRNLLSFIRKSKDSNLSFLIVLRVCLVDCNRYCNVIDIPMT